MNIDKTIESLYVINKGAKKFRDLNYQAPKNFLYNLKEEVMSKLIKEKILTYEGYHIFQCEKVKYDLTTEYYEVDFDYYVYSNFGFHIKRESDIVKSDFLGYINEKISSEKIDVSLTLFESIIILKKYLNKNINLSDVIFCTKEYGFIDKKNIKRNTLKLFDFLLEDCFLVNTFYGCYSIECTISYEYLSNKLGLTKKTLQNNLNKLIDLNLMQFDSVEEKYYIVDCIVNL